MRNLLIVGLVGFGLVGCATPKYNYQATIQNISKPPLNSENTAYVGDKMLEQGRLLEKEALYVPETTKYSGYTLDLLRKSLLQVYPVYECSN